MKRVYFLVKTVMLTYICILIMMLTSCDYFGSFRFTINNRTDKEVRISYNEQLRSYEDILPTYEHGDDYEYTRLATTDTSISIPPYQSKDFIYDVGTVNIHFPTSDDTPESWGIVPLWERITSIVLGSDTINSSNYSKDKWERSASDYTLNIYSFNP